MPEVKYIFELNPDHVLVKRAADTEDEAKFRRLGRTALRIRHCRNAARWKIRTCLFVSMNQLLVS
ncbi:hypothetical protein ACLBOM_27290 [Escherichia coli]